MNRLSKSQADEFAALLEGYEDDIAEANLKKSATLDDIRQALRDAGLKGADLAADLAQFRDAVAEHRLMRVNPAKLAKKLEKREGADFYLFLLTQKASRTHEADFSARGDRAQTEPVTPHDPDTGEIIEPTRTDGSTESCGDVDGHMPSEGGVTSQSASPLTQQGTATPDSLDEVGRPQSATLQSGSSGSECIRTTHSPATVGIQSGPQDTLPKQVHKAIGGAPLSPQPAEPVVADIPEIFRRNPDAKHWQKIGGTA